MGAVVEDLQVRPRRYPTPAPQALPAALEFA